MTSRMSRKEDRNLRVENSMSTCLAWAKASSCNKKSGWEYRVGPDPQGPRMLSKGFNSFVRDSHRS